MSFMNFMDCNDQDKCKFYLWYKKGEIKEFPCSNCSDT